MTRAEDIRIESDERGFELHVLVDDWPTMTESGWMVVNIHNVAPELFEQVKRQIGEWLIEGESAVEEYKRQLRNLPFHCSDEDVDESAGLAEVTEADLLMWPQTAQEEDAYEPDDPKSPRYHSTHADIWDNREKGGRTF